jgi:hypothetical protein
MGASPYFYVVDYEPDIQASLNKLRDREFRAGRYNPVMPFPSFPVDEASPNPGARHATIDEALEDSDADGTRSILDLDRVVSGPYDADEDDFGTVAPLGDEMLQEYFGTTRPNSDEVEEAVWDVFEEINRGTGIYIVIYNDDMPTKIFFAGYSFD